MYKDTSYLGSTLPQVTFSKRNKHCSFRLMEQNKTKHPLALSRVEPRVTKFDKVPMFYSQTRSSVPPKNTLMNLLFKS